MPLFLLVCLQDLQEGLVRSLIIGIALLDLLWVLNGAVKLFFLPGITYKGEISW